MRNLLVFVFLSTLTLGAETTTFPYLQHVTENSAELYWVSRSPESIRVEWLGYESHSQASPAPELSYHEQEVREFPELDERSSLYLHKVKLTGLTANQTIRYAIHYREGSYRNTFQSLPPKDKAVRLIAYADSETEPESTGKLANWGHPVEPKRPYLIDQTRGYEWNLQAISQRAPNAVLIAGDLVQSGGEQRDWDEFWYRNRELAARIPLLPAPGNHEYWSGPKQGGYEPNASQWAISKYRTYFHPKGQTKASPYYSQDIGRATIISLDSGDGFPNKSRRDTNYHLEAVGQFTPGFHKGSEQRRWLKKELQRAQKAGQFIIVMFHHCPYSSGPHGFEAGNGAKQDTQSGQPLRSLTPLLTQYGVAVILSGHDEMFERSEISGVEMCPDGSLKPYRLQVYDVGVGGDGLRRPSRHNQFSEFLAYRDSPEIWKNGQLKSGGRHYGHLEIEVVPRSRGHWKATLRSIYLLPILQNEKWTFERCVYQDTITLSR